MGDGHGAAAIDLIAQSWPAEGRSFGWIVEQLVGHELWAHLLDWTGEQPSLGPAPHKVRGSFVELWSVDFEFRVRDGWLPYIVCTVAREYRSGREI